MAKEKLVVNGVKKCTGKWFVTARNPERGTITNTNYYECLLKCGHVEYRRQGGRHEPTALACGGCSARDLTASELAINSMLSPRARAAKI